MGKETLKQKIMDFIAGVSYKIFLWSINKTEHEYWTEIYFQEKKYREGV